MERESPTLTVRNLLINYLNVIKEFIQKQLLTKQMLFEIGVLKHFAILRGKRRVGVCF